MADKFYKDTVGTVIEVDCGRDISTANQYFYNVRKPSGTIVRWTPVKIADKSKLEYVVKRGDWNEVGVYTLQVYLQLPTWAGLSTSITFKLWDAFE